jgi:hypothetical protein
MSLPILLLGIPDLGYSLVMSGGVALSWGILRTALAYFVLRESGAVDTAGRPAIAS